MRDSAQLSLSGTADLPQHEQLVARETGSGDVFSRARVCAGNLRPATDLDPIADLERSLASCGVRLRRSCRGVEAHSDSRPRRRRLGGYAHAVTAARGDARTQPCVRV